MYFLYSREQIREKDNVLSPQGKKFKPGIVIINNKRTEFTQLSSSSDMPRFIDTKIVAQGEVSNFTYELPKAVSKEAME
jgi:hypothetical protein